MRNRQAARLLLIDDRGRVLLVQFENGRGERWWAAPGGGVDPGETIEQALAREAEEELGLSDVPPATVQPKAGIGSCATSAVVRWISSTVRPPP